MHAASQEESEEPPKSGSPIREENAADNLVTTMVSAGRKQAGAPRRAATHAHACSPRGARDAVHTMLGAHAMHTPPAAARNAAERHPFNADYAVPKWIETLFSTERESIAEHSVLEIVLHHLNPTPASPSSCTASAHTDADRRTGEPYTLLLTAYYEVQHLQIPQRHPPPS